MWQGEAWQGKAWQGEVWQGKVRCGKVRCGKVRHGKVRCGKVRCAKVRKDRVSGRIKESGACRGTLCRRKKEVINRKIEKSHLSQGRERWV